MSSSFWLVLAIVGAIALAWVISAFRTYGRYRGQMLFTCPENNKPAAVHVSAVKAAFASPLSHSPLQLHDCSRWPERAGCGQECLSQLGANPENCLVWNKVADWYRGRTCAYCHRPFTTLRWHDHYPALMAPDHTTVQWNEVKAEQLPELLATHLPVCWSCHIAETFRREHPERVTDRPFEPLARRM